MSNKKCQHCGGTDIDVDPARGDAVCMSCGSVLEDTIIVSEVQFEENAYGGSSALGQFVASDSRGLSGFATAYRGGGGKESREITIRRARERITDLAQKLRLNQHCTDTAVNFFKMALSANLTYGRKSTHVVAACIYITCRLEGTPHLLIDIADELQINVHTLGHTFMKLAQALCLRIPAIDPCLYILRFANSLGFQDKAHEVSMTAIRLVQRMKRDWIHTGRRPSGLCGAALLIAARLHDFSRSVKDIIKVVKVHEFTLRKRLNEFGETPSSSLTLDEFLTVDLEEEHDPPAFKASRKKDREKLSKLLEEDGHVSDELSNLQKEIERQLEERRAKLRGPWAKYAKASTGETSGATPSVDEPVNEEAVEQHDVEKFLAEDAAGLIQSCLQGDEQGENAASEEKIDAQNLETILMPPPDSTYLQMRNNLRPTMASLGIKTDYVREKEEEQPETSGELTLEDIDDEEIESYLMTPKEINYKTEMWMKLNGDFLKEQEEKRLKKLQEEEETGKIKKKRNTRRPRNAPIANTPAEAIEKMLQEKKISSKINYDVLRSLSSVCTPSSDDTADTSMPTPSTSAETDSTAALSGRKRPKAEPTLANAKKLKSEKTENDKKKPKNEKKADDLKPVPAARKTSHLSVDNSVSEGPEVAEETQPQEGEENVAELAEEIHDTKEMSTAEMLRQMRGEEEEYEEDYY